MSFQPVVPLSGIPGWRFLQSTEQAQRATFERSGLMERDAEYFRQNIANVATADDLLADRRLLRVALGAFGLDEDIGKTAFLRKVLAEGTDDPGSFANRFVDPRYRELSAAFGFGNLGGPQTLRPGFAGEVVSAFRERQFEIAVGNQDTDMRLALGFRREIGRYASDPNADSAAWFRILGSQPLRRVFEAAYNLPSQFGGLDVDQQRDILRDRTQDLFGSRSLAVFRDPAAVEKLIDRFLVAQQALNGPSASAPGAAALTLLQNAAGGAGSAARINLILSGA